eukprot:382209-Pyramimonas_sp.AAC.1
MSGPIGGGINTKLKSSIYTDRGVHQSTLSYYLPPHNSVPNQAIESHFESCRPPQTASSYRVAKLLLAELSAVLASP